MAVYDAEIKYIESSGTQLLDTGISGGTSVEYALNFECCDGNSGWAQYFGSSRNESYAPKVFRWDENPYKGYSYAEWYTTSATSLRLGLLNIGEQYLCEFRGGDFSLNGSVLASPGNLGFGSNTFCIFGYKPEINLKSKLRLYACRVWLDGTLVRDMIPVRVGQVGYMYDRVSDTLIGNSGTGSFILGADKRKPTSDFVKADMISLRRRLMMAVSGELPIIDGHEYVDLGLPSGTLWATMNLDATNVYDIGLYYRWGEVIGFTTGNTSAYKWNGDNPTKYNNTDGLTELELEDDAVHVNWGGGWVMPTKTQLAELVSTSNTTRSRVTNYLGSGVDGYIYKSKTNNKEIFFPDNGEYVGATKYNGTKIYYWSKTRGSDVRTAATIADNGTSTKDEHRIYFLGMRGVYNINI